MKFSAQIFTEELRFEDDVSDKISRRSTPIHFFESDSMTFTIEIGGGRGGIKNGEK